MFVPNDIFFRGRGEPPRRPKKEFIKSAGGYPEIRDPAAENPKGVLPKEVNATLKRRMRQKYAAGSSTSFTR